MKNFREYVEQTATKKDNIRSASTTQLQYPTGFMYLDYINGSTVICYDDDENPFKMYDNIGIMNGSLNMIIGKSQVGKSTIASKLAVGILESWLNPVVRAHLRIDELNPGVEIPMPLLHYVDTEKTMSADYIKKMSGYRNRELKAILELSLASTDKDLQQALKWHCKYKEDNMPKIKMSQCDLYGKPIVNYPPTVMIIDSMTQVNSEDSDEATDEAYAHATQLTAGARRAQMIGKMNTMLVNVAKKYNIIIFEISHINVAPQMSIVPVAKQFRALKQGETIAGGEKQLYLATSILRLDFLKNVGTEKASMKNLGEGVTGFITEARFIKTKSNSRGFSANLVYTNEKSYDPLISTMYQAMEVGDVTKVGNNYILDDYPDIKFNIKNFLDVFAENPVLITAFYDQMSKKLRRYLDNPDAKNNTSNNSDSVDPLGDIELFGGDF